METYCYSPFLGGKNAELINMLLLIDKQSESVQNKKSKSFLTVMEFEIQSIKTSLEMKDI